MKRTLILLLSLALIFALSVPALGPGRIGARQNSSIPHSAAAYHRTRPSAENFSMCFRLRIFATPPVV